MSLTAIPAPRATSTRERLSEMVRTEQEAQNPKVAGIDAKILQDVIDEYLRDSEVAALVKLVRKAPTEALSGLCRNLLDATSSPRTVARNTMYLFDVLSRSYYYSARPINYKKIHGVIAGMTEDITSMDEVDAREARRVAIARLCIHVDSVRIMN